MNMPLFPYQDEIEPPYLRVIVARADGSMPREAGAGMVVGVTDAHGTIGGGRLEFEAIAHAREILDGYRANQEQWQREQRVWPLGPSLGQCCGGSVRILFELLGSEELRQVRQMAEQAARGALIARPLVSGVAYQVVCDRRVARDLPLPAGKIASEMLSGTRQRSATCAGENPAQGGQASMWFLEPLVDRKVPLFVYGAGHVGRAIVKIAADLDLDLHWVDTARDRFPSILPGAVTCIPASQPDRVAAMASADAFHLVLTYSHALDLAICQTLLAKNNFGFLGLIGSATKRARFRTRLSAAGIASQALTRLTCPIGTGALKSKAPAVIAVDVAAQLIQQCEKTREQAFAGHAGNDGTDGRLSA